MSAISARVWECDTCCEQHYYALDLPNFIERRYLCDRCYHLAMRHVL